MRRLDTSLTRWAWVLVAVLLLARLHLLNVRLYDPDEFEHLHVAYSMAHGEVLYRDFFEHHGPLPYFLTAPLVRWFGAEPRLLTVNRLVSFVLVLLTLAPVHRLANRLYGRSAGPLALAWLVSFPWFVEKSVEWRPDVPAMCLVAWAAWFAIGRSRSAWAVGFPTGLMLGLASLCTQKVAFLGLGIIVGALLHRRAARQPLAGHVGAGCLGFALPWFACCGWFYAHDSLRDFLLAIFHRPLAWPIRERYAIGLLTHNPLGWAPAHEGLAVVGLVAGAVRLARARCRCRGEPVVVLPCIGHFAALPLVPAVYLQYYLLAEPLVAVVAGGILLRLLEAGRSRFASRSARGWRAVPLVAALIACSWGLYSLRQSLGNALPVLTEFVQGDLRTAVSRSARLPLYGVADLVTVAFLVAGAMLWPVRHKVGVAVVWLALVFPAGARVAIPHFFWRSDKQLADLRLVMSSTKPTDPVLDGFTGLGCLRPHACYWWWINPHSVALMKQTGGVRVVVDAIERGVPALILYDRDLGLLRTQIGPAIEKRYRRMKVRTQVGGIALLLRDDRAPPATPSVPSRSVP